MPSPEQILRKHTGSFCKELDKNTKELIIKAMMEFKYQEEEPIFLFNEDVDLSFYAKYNILDDIINDAERLTNGKSNIKGRNMNHSQAKHIVRAFGYWFSGLSTTEVVNYMIGSSSHMMILFSQKALEGYLLTDKRMTRIITEIFNKNYSAFLLARSNYSDLSTEGKTIVEKTTERIDKYPIFQKLINKYHETISNKL